MNKKCLSCEAYLPDVRRCRIVYWQPIDGLNVNGLCGFYIKDKKKRKLVRLIEKHKTEQQWTQEN